MTDFAQPQLQLHHLETTDDEAHPAKNPAGRHLPPRPSALPRKSLVKGERGRAGGASRRRSSARFLSMGGRNRNGEEDLSHEGLNKMYKQAIKMNTENRINASNSWNFKLIENIDKFLTDDPETSSQRRSSFVSNNTTPSSTQPPRPPRLEQGRVNFTKASSTLDASVKIYSYRVDDVHLTSYRVLENLHRSDGDKKKKNQDTTAGETDITEDPEEGRQKTHRSRAAASTVETNVAAINLNKLDSAFDIDPLFHKMSKTFDEGGAKGLLLVNLGTSGNGCNIVFDSGLADDEEEKSEEDSENGPQESAGKTVDISSLTAKLEGLLSGQSIHSLSLVPQLAGLRAEFSRLEDEGFVDKKDVEVSLKQRFAPDPDEEKEADKSIHQDVLERSAVKSRFSTGRVSLGRSFVGGDEDGMTMPNGDDNDQEYGGDDFGGFDDDDDAFDAFIAADDNGQRYSSVSFGDPVPLESQGAAATTVLLDAIESGQVLGETEFEFFDTQELSHVAANAWAGSAHWKPVAHLHKPKVTNEPKTAEKKKAPRSKKGKDRVFVDLTQQPDLSDILRKPPKAKGRRATDPLQFTAASVTKYTKNENLLPPDAGIRPNVLSSLFLRPNSVIKPKSDAEPVNPPKTVGFAMDQVETFGGNAWDDGSFGGGDDDDGPGFAMSDSFDGDEGGRDFVVEDLDGVRKVEKVSVSYATIAKKVDVKRLKRDLWTEVESHLKQDKASAKASDGDGDEEEDEDIVDFPTTPTSSRPLSFQSTVQSMEANKTQVDVTLPFYFICILHLANEKGLRLEPTGLEDFEIHNGEGGGSFF